MVEMVGKLFSDQNVWHKMCNGLGIMKNTYSIFTALLLTFFLALGGQSVQAQNTPDEVFAKLATAIQTGNAEAVSAYMQSPVELTLPGTDQAYSAQQATFVLKDFFAKNTPKSFAIVHKGNSGTTNYATGTLVTSGGTYDANIFIKKVDDAFKVTQLRFEAE
jgi:hypothetical protein